MIAAIVCVGSSAGYSAPLAGSGDCREVKLISVRGSGDTLNAIGKLGVRISGALARRAREQGVDYRVHGLEYTAVGIDWKKIVFPLYVRSKNEGRDKLRALVREQVRSCPKQKLALLGFSQGAHVVGDVLSKNVGGLTKDELASVRAVALVADPRFNSREPFATGEDLKGGRNGILGARSPGDLESVAGRIRSWCRAKDLVCQGLPNPLQGIHDEQGYHEAYGEAIVDFLARKLGWREVVDEIAFETNRDGNSEVYVMNADGTGERNLTRNRAADFGHVWSPDARRIAFNRNRDGNVDVYVMSADGSHQRNLSRSQGGGGGPVWSPDGRRIAFNSNRDGNVEVYVMNADGTGQRNLTRNEADDWGPVWSPDGQRLAFKSDRDGNVEVYVMNADGSGQRNLTRDQASDWAPVWSPDGRRIAFMCGRTGEEEVCVMNGDGGGRRNLTPNEADDYGPVWSPDGRRIAFGSNRDGNAEVYVMNPDGSGQRNLTRNQSDDAWPAWSPDGRRIAFTSDRDGKVGVYAMNADGSGQRRLQSQAYAPSWAPSSGGTG